MPTKIGGAQAVKLFNAALYMESVRKPCMTNMLTGSKPTNAQNEKKMRGQTEPGAPIVRVTDLAKGRGDEVTVDILHQPNMLPTMGDRKLAGRMGSMSWGEDTITINQSRAGMDSGGRMSQQRTNHQLKMLAKQLLGSSWFHRLEDQRALVTLAGARGNQKGDWIVPVDTHAEFAEIMVNPITPPTWDRHFYGGDATAIDNIDSADIFSLNDVDNVRLFLDEMEFPLQGISYEGDESGSDDPFHLMMVTPRQMYDFTQSTTGKELNAMKAEAMSRTKGFNHPVFRGDCFMWKGILVKKATRSIGFSAGTNVAVSTNTADAQTTTATTGVNVHRGLLLGAQAMATAMGNVQDAESEGGKSYFKYHSETEDHGNATEHSLWFVSGNKKLRFKGTDGRVNDHGVMVVDTAVSTN